MSTPRKLSVRKSDGSVFDSSDDESKTTPWKNLKKETSEVVETTKIFFHTFSKFLPKKIQLKIQNNERQVFFFTINTKIDATVYSVEECNTLLLSPAEMILRRLVPYRYYSATLNQRSGIVEHSNLENDQNEWTTVVQICPKSGINFGKGKISRITTFNVTKKQIFEIDKNLEAKIGVCQRKNSKN